MLSEGSTYKEYCKIRLIQIPLPPLKVQEQIVAEIDASYQRVIDGARQVVDSYKPQIQIAPEWPMSYKGKAVADGTIDVEDLIDGLKGLSLIVSAIDENIRINVTSFEKGSFESVLEFIEKIPVLFDTTEPAIMLAIIGWFIQHIIRSKGAKNITVIKAKKMNINILEPELKQIIPKILQDKQRLRKIKKRISRYRFSFITKV